MASYSNIQESIDLMFLKSKGGYTIFFPWGSRGKAYILESPETERKTRRILEIYYKYGLFSWLIVFFLIQLIWKLPLNFLVTLLPAAIIWIGSLFPLLKYLTKNLTPSNETYSDLLLKKYLD